MYNNPTTTPPLVTRGLTRTGRANIYYQRPEGAAHQPEAQRIPDANIDPQLRGLDVNRPPPPVNPAHSRSPSPVPVDNQAPPPRHTTTPPATPPRRVDENRPLPTSNARTLQNPPAHLTQAKVDAIRSNLKATPSKSNGIMDILKSSLE